TGCCLVGCRPRDSVGRSPRASGSGLVRNSSQSLGRGSAGCSRILATRVAAIFASRTGHTMALVSRVATNAVSETDCVHAPAHRLHRDAAILPVRSFLAAVVLRESAG